MSLTAQDVGEAIARQDGGTENLRNAVATMHAVQGTVSIAVREQLTAIDSAIASIDRIHVLSNANAVTAGDVNGATSDVQTSARGLLRLVDGFRTESAAPASLPSLLALS